MVANARETPHEGPIQATSLWVVSPGLELTHWRRSGFDPPPGQGNFSSCGKDGRCPEEMLGGGTVKQMYELAGGGQSIRGIARSLGISRNTVRKYLRSPQVPTPRPRPGRVSKLDPYKPYIRQRLAEEVDNCVVLLREIRAQGYAGGYTILKEFMKPYRLPRTWSCPGFVDTLRLAREVLTMPRTRPPYPPEFRRQMVELVRAPADSAGVGARVRALVRDDPGLGQGGRPR